MILSNYDNTSSWESDAKCCYHGSSLQIRVGLRNNNCLLFDTTEFSLIRGYITGLVGVNGSGKTSLARVIASKKLPGFPDGLKVNYISAHDMIRDEDYDVTTEEYLNSLIESNLASLRGKIAELENELDNVDPSKAEDIANSLAEKYDEEQDLEVKMKEEITQTLDELKYGDNISLHIANLSSGWRYKTYLVSSFLSRPDLLIIDEPSFLDQSSTNWLVNMLKKLAKSFNAMVLFISHKEALLEKLCDRILHINNATNTLTSYNCNYRSFRDMYDRTIEDMEKQCESYHEKVTEADKNLKAIQSQMEKKEKNLRKTTSENSDQRFIKGKNKESKQKADKSAMAKIKQLKHEAAEIEDIKKQAKREYVKPLRISGAVADYSAVVTLNDVCFKYDSASEIFRNLSGTIGPKDKVLLCGANGAGKSTLLKLLIGEVEPTAGALVRRGQALYFPQAALTKLNADYGYSSSLSYLGNNLTETAARQHLGEYGLSGDVALRNISSLSAGQRVRLWLAKQLLHIPKPTVLIMDEISENLDIDTRDSLIEVLNSFVGAVIAVSHDEDFCSTFYYTQKWHLSSKGLLVEFNDT